MSNVVDLGTVDYSRRYCRSVWTDPASTEDGAPKSRIIHTTFFQLLQPSIIRRFGVRDGVGFLKCQSRVGSSAESMVDVIQGVVASGEVDRPTAVRFLMYFEDDWHVALDLDDIDGRGEIAWFDVPGSEPVTAIACELRRSRVDGWWPSWNLASSAFLVEGEPLDAEARSPGTDGVLTVEEVEMGKLSSSVAGWSDGVTVRFSTPFLEVGFYLRRPAMSFLCLDATGSGQTRDNLLRLPGCQAMESHGPLAEYLTQGPAFEGVGMAPLVGYTALGYVGTTVVRGNEVLYRFTMGNQQVELTWRVHADRITLSVRRDVMKHERALTSSPWRIVGDTRRSIIGTLGTPFRVGQTGSLRGDAYWHAPQYGTLRLSSEQAFLARFDSIRPLTASLLELMVGEIPQKEGDYLLPSGIHEAHIEMVVETPKLMQLSADAPDPVRAAGTRHALTALACYRADTATYSNNANSMHCPFCADVWGALSMRLTEVGGLAPLEYLQDSLKRVLTGAPGYGSGGTSHGPFQLVEEYTMSAANPIVALGEYLTSAEPIHRTQWFAEFAEGIDSFLHMTRSLDVDDDGLIESERRTGQNGIEWSTNWFDDIGFGWKDAFVNANLYHGLVLLAEAFSEMGDHTRRDAMLAWSEKLRANYTETFLNDETGWLAGWRSRDGRLHDYAFLCVNGAAVNAGLLDPPTAKSIMTSLLGELNAVGFETFALGLPVSLRPIADEDLTWWVRSLPFGTWQNGGVTHSQAWHFVNGLYRVGLTEDADRILSDLAEGLVSMDVFGGCHSGLEWRMWDGYPCGYEGQLMDQFAILATIVDRYGATTDERADMPRSRSRVKRS